MSQKRKVDEYWEPLALVFPNPSISENIVICNLEFEGGRGQDVDGIQIKPNSRNIWIDRYSLRDFDDGLIDITRQSTDITVSMKMDLLRSVSVVSLLSGRIVNGILVVTGTTLHVITSRFALVLLLSASSTKTSLLSAFTCPFFFSKALVSCGAHK
ncbi:hypothetical protein SLA2020_150740 [Shorea laevis]